MSKDQIKKLLEKQLTEKGTSEDGLLETDVKGVQLFRVTKQVDCRPVVYEPSVIAILSGSKEASLDGKTHIYDSSQYLCCTMSMPVEAGTSEASPDNPLLGVYIPLDTRLMTEIAIEMQTAVGAIRTPRGSEAPKGIVLAQWDPAFTDALLRLVQLADNPVDTAVLGDCRLRELYYAILNGEAGESAKSAFGVGNEIARAIGYLATHLHKTITIEDMAAQVGMSRAVLHRKFKQATGLSPIQFVKSIRLNTAAAKISEGKNVNQAAMDVGYVSSSQFSREFKRMFGQSPKQWRQESQQGYKIGV